MAAIRIYVLNDNEKDPLVKIGDDYLKRCSKRYAPERINLKTAKRNKNSADSVVRLQESERLLEATKNCFRIALDAEGRQLTSLEFSKWIEKTMAQGRPLAFLIGGPSGHHPSLLKSADATLSLSPMTFPHRLCYVFLAEQVYRSHEIERGGPYNR